MHKWLYLIGVSLILYGVYNLSLPYWEALFSTQSPVSMKNSIRWIIPEKQQPIKSQKLYQEIPPIGSQMGFLEIPRLSIKFSIIQGSHENELAKGIGHYYKSALPGESDNVVLGGHRDTVFRRLGEIQKGDKIRIQTDAGVFTYQVTGTKIVSKDDRSIIVSTYPNPRLTLVTCYPFGFLGSAPKRFIVFADLVDSKYH